MIINKKNITFNNIRPVDSKDIVKAGLTLGIGYTILPFINFKDAKNYQPFKDKSKDTKDEKWLQ